MDEENILDENTLTQGDGSYYDYCQNVPKEYRTKLIAYLVNDILPKGMFTLVDSDEMIYNGGAEEWKAEWVKNIHEKAMNVTTDNVLDWIGPTYQLEKEFKNPLHTDHHFYLSEDTCQSYAEPSAELMKMICALPVGTHLYFGGIIDFHF